MRRAPAAAAVPSGSAAGTVFKIGFAADLSGGDSSSMCPTVTACSTLSTKSTTAGGVAGMKLELIVKDQKNDAALAAQVTHELISEGIQYLAGTTSDNVVACNRIAAEAEIPSDCGVGTAPNKVMTPVNGHCGILMSGQHRAPRSSHCYEDLGYESAYLLRSADSTYTTACPSTSRMPLRSLAARLSASPTTNSRLATSLPR